MKVKDAIEMLQKCDSEAEVVLSSDAEGNGFLPLASYWECFYIETGDGYEVDARCKSDFEEDDHAKPAVVLWPI